MLEVRGLAAGYLGERIVAGIDVEVGAGEAVALVGSNGAGKTTLLRAIAGLLAPMEGRVLLDGKDLTRRPAYRLGALRHRLHVAARQQTGAGVAVPEGARGGIPRLLRREGDGRGGQGVAARQRSSIYCSVTSSAAWSEWGGPGSTAAPARAT